MIIGVCGFGYTGSGAVLDFLKEFEENQVIDRMEFSIAYSPDGLEDLEYHLVKSPSRYFACDIAIRRFKNYVRSKCTPKSGFEVLTRHRFIPLSEEFIKRLIQAKWRGSWSFDGVEASYIQKKLIYRMLARLQLVSDRLFGKFIPIYPEREICLSVRPENFYEQSRWYVQALLTSMGRGDRHNIVLDQPFCADNPEKSFVFFNDPLAIIVDRDPRDLYLLAKKVVLSKGRFMPSDDVKSFIAYYRALREHCDPIREESRVLKLQFEDLIYEYDKTARRIMDFSHLEHHAKTKQYFDPAVSQNNTQLFRKYPEFFADISCIEKELKAYLFPFEKYEPVIGCGKSF